MTRSQKNNLDKLLREACFARDGHKCLRCGRTDTLAPSHIYPKGRYRKMRWDLRNVVTLCFNCHFHFWHKNPIEAHDWLKGKLPKDRLEALKLRSQVNDATPMDYELIRLDLESEIKKYE